MGKYYYRVLNEIELNQHLTYDRIVSDKVIEDVGKSVIHSISAKNKFGHDLLDSNGKKIVDKVNYNIKDSIASINEYMYNIDRASNPRTISMVAEEIKKYGINMDPDILPNHVDVIKKIINCFYRTDDFKNMLVKTFNSFDRVEKDDLDFMTKNNIRVVKVQAGDEIENHVDCLKSSNGIDYAIIIPDVNKPYITYFYNHIEPIRYNHNKDNDKLGDDIDFSLMMGKYKATEMTSELELLSREFSLWPSRYKSSNNSEYNEDLVDYLTPLELDFKLLNGIDENISFNQIIRAMYRVFDKNLNTIPYRTFNEAIMRYLVKNYYQSNQFNISTLIDSTGSSPDIIIPSIIAAKEMLISGVKHYLETDDDSFHFDDVYGKDTSIVTLEKKFFQNNK